MPGLLELLLLQLKHPGLPECREVENNAWYIPFSPQDEACFLSPAPERLFDRPRLLSACCL